MEETEYERFLAKAQSSQRQFQSSTQHRFLGCLSAFARTIRLLSVLRLRCGENSLILTYALSSACRRSFTRSCGFSMPQARRIMLSGMP